MSESLTALIARESEAIATNVRHASPSLVEARRNARAALTPENGFYLCAIVSEDGAKTFRSWPFYFNEVWGHTVSTDPRNLDEDEVFENLCPSILDHMLVEWHVRGEKETHTADMYKRHVA